MIVPESMYVCEYMKDQIFELRGRCEDKTDHHSYTHNLADLKFELEK